MVPIALKPGIANVSTITTTTATITHLHVVRESENASQSTILAINPYLITISYKYY